MIKPRMKYVKGGYFFGIQCGPWWVCYDDRATETHEYPGMAYLLWKEAIEEYESMWYIKLWRKIQALWNGKMNA